MPNHMSLQPRIRITPGMIWYSSSPDNKGSKERSKTGSKKNQGVYFFVVVDLRFGIKAGAK